MAGETCCCGCCSVRTGTKVIAAYSIVSSIISITTEIINLGSFSNRSAQDSNPWSTRKTQDHDDGAWLYPASALGIVLCIVQLVLSSLLYAGASENNERKCLPWLWFNSVLTVLIVIVFSILGIYLAAAHDFATGFFLLVVMAVAVAINVYLLNVVYLYIQELREGGGGSVWYHSPTQRTIA